MPIVRIDMYPGRDKATKEKLISKVSQDVAEIVKCPIEAVTVVIQDIAKENWGFGGQQSK